MALRVASFAVALAPRAAPRAAPLAAPRAASCVVHRTALRKRFFPYRAVNTGRAMPPHAMSEQAGLYPPVEPYESGMLKVSSMHDIYWEEVGNPDGVPILFVHGGPGGGIEPKCSRFFDPSRFRVILFAQRGCGRSTPLGCLEENTTWDLVSDMEALRVHRGVDRWALFGGSWGSCLSLAYAQRHPAVVTAMVLRGIFTLRKSEVDWFYERGGAAMLAPKEHDAFINGLPEDMRCRPCLVDAFHEVFSSDDTEAARRAALAWSSWEGATSYFVPPGGPMKYGEADFAVVFARIECHYFRNAGFFERDGYLLEEKNMEKIRHIPTTIVQGRWDIVCPIRTAYDLHVSLPDAEFRVVNSAGHSSFETGVASELVHATNRLAETL